MLEELLEFLEGKEMAWRGYLLVVWLDPEDLEEFAELLGSDFLNEINGLNVTLLPNGVVAIVMNEVAHRLEIEPSDILPND